MSGRAHGNKSVLRLAAQNRINGQTGSARAPQSGIERAHGDDRIRVQIPPALAHSALDHFVVLRRMARLHITTGRRLCLHLGQLRPQLCVSFERIKRDLVARGLFRVMLARIVLLKDRMMNDGGRHKADYARARAARSNPSGGPLIPA